MEYIIISIGDNISPFLKDAFDEYTKRLKKFAKVEFIDLKTPNKINQDPNIANIKNYEATQIINKIENNSYVILMDLSGTNLSSTEFAKKINQIKTSGYSKITFIIGGSNGVHDKIKKISHYQIAFGKNTFPHQLFKVMMLEQIYRAEKINNNQQYHK